jgi:hypothetical protein
MEFSNNNNNKLPPKNKSQSRSPNIWEHDTRYPSLDEILGAGYLKVVDEDNPVFHCPSQPYTNVISKMNSNWKIYDYSYFGNHHMSGNVRNGPSQGWIDYPSSFFTAESEMPLFADGVELDGDGHSNYQHNNHGYNSPRRRNVQGDSVFYGMGQIHMDGSGKWFYRNQTEIVHTTHYRAKISWGLNE